MTRENGAYAMQLVSAVAQGAVTLEDAKRELARVENERCCEACGDPTPYRRLRCGCGLLVCSWCRGHVHSAKVEPVASPDSQEAQS